MPDQKQSGDGRWFWGLGAALIVIGALLYVQNENLWTAAILGGAGVVLFVLGFVEKDRGAPL